MFKCDPNADFWADINLRQPGGEQATFKAKFRLIEAGEFDQAHGLIVKGDNPKAARESLLRRIFVGWDGVVDPKDETPQAFTEERMLALARHTWFSAPVLNTYIGEITGRGALKN